MLTKTEDGAVWASHSPVSLLERHTYSFTGNAMAPGEVQTVSGTITQSGCKMLGVMAWKVNSSWLNCFGITCNDTLVACRLRNASSVTLTPVFDVSMLYAREG
ncbi:MAG: hypothetical protein Q4C54_03940 [Clostridia bacterium]|nr:hypothetical protein [Clostridia bacterium]